MTQMEQDRDQFAPLAEESIRLLLPSENADYAAHLLRLDPLSRFMRFAGYVTDSAVRRHAARVADERAVVLGYFADGELRGVAELHPLPVRAGRLHSAEIAFSVERPWQGRGIGSRLMDRIIAYARAHGFEDLQLMFLASNGRMKRMAIERDVQLTNDADEVIGSLQPRAATPFTWAREAARGVGAAARAASTMPRRLFLPRPSEK
jgi:GNAT superfamily N-acetyltransferase